jgi:hypothetical protein
MPAFAARFTALPLVALCLVSVSAQASDKADCASALKAAQADKASGKLAKALTDLGTCSRPVCAKAMRKQCTDLADAVTASQPTVIFSAKDASGNAVTAVTVTVDGAAVASSLDGAPVVVDPGSHAMKFESEGATPVEKQISVDPEVKGQRVAIDLDVNPPPPPVAVVAPVAAPPPSDGPGTMTDTSEDPTKRYYFIGLRYRGDIVPQFMINMFVDGGQTLYSNSIGIEADLRHDGFSLIPALTYSDYGTGDMLFLQKGKDAADPGNWSLVNSGLKAIYASADLLWSVRIANHWEFEYGAEFGLGVLFGTLEDNWVTPTNGTQVSASNYTACQTITQGIGCSPANHQNATTNKVGGYQEPSWVNGGSKPNIFPLINFPQVGLRYKPIKQMEARFGLGFSLTGFWFGLSADYGLEKPTK